MRRTRLIASCVVAASLSALGVPPTTVAVAAAGALPAQSSDEQMVKVTVTPRELRGKTWEFEVALNTHVQPLADDLVKSSVLIDPAGQRHAPLAWRGDAPGGHHRKGVLVFAPLEPRPSPIELRIQRAGESAPRSFKWQLQ